MEKDIGHPRTLHIYLCTEVSFVLTWDILGSRFWALAFHLGPSKTATKGKFFGQGLPIVLKYIFFGSLLFLSYAGSSTFYNVERRLFRFF